MEGEAQQRGPKSYNDQVDDYHLGALLVEPAAKEWLGKAVEQGAHCSGYGDGAPVPLELLAHGNDENPHGAPGAGGNHGDEKAGGDHVPPVVDAGVGLAIRRCQSSRCLHGAEASRADSRGMDAGLGFCIITPAAGSEGNHKGCPYVEARWPVFEATTRVVVTVRRLGAVGGIRVNHKGCRYG